MALILDRIAEGSLDRWGPSLALGTIIIVLLVGIKGYFTTHASIGIINGRRPFELGQSKAKARYKQNAKKLLLEGLEKSKAFFLVTDNQRLLVLANEYANEICKHPDMNLSKAVERDLPSDIPGFEGYRDDYFPDYFGVGVIRNKFGKGFSPYLTPMSSEIAAFLKANWACSSGSQKLYLRDTLLRLVTRLTATIRTGELADNAEWLRICIDFQTQIYIAAADLARYPKPLQHIAHWYLPSCQKLRADIKQARLIFEPFLEARRLAKRKAREAGQDPPRYDDLADWLEEGARHRKYDETMAQLVNAQATCLGASDLLPTILIYISKDRSLLQRLRQEILDVIGKEGLSQDSLSRLDLMDSVAKESSRMRLIHTVGLKRYAEKDIKMPDGFKIPRGSVVAIAMERMWDEQLYPDPLIFHGDRFLKQRQEPGQERDARSTTVSSDFLGFGLGRHACPGRFYVAYLMKLVLCHILLKYDIEAVNETLFVEELEIRPRMDELDLGEKRRKPARNGI